MGTLEVKKIYETIHDVDIDSRSRSAHPKVNLNDDKFLNQNAYNDYTQIIIRCTQTFEAKESSDIKA